MRFGDQELSNDVFISARRPPGKNPCLRLTKLTVECDQSVGGDSDSMSLFDHSRAGVTLHGIASAVGLLHTGVESTPRRVLQSKMNDQENKNNRAATMEKGGKIQRGNARRRIVWLLITYVA